MCKVINLILLYTGLQTNFGLYSWPQQIVIIAPVFNMRASIENNCFVYVLSEFSFRYLFYYLGSLALGIVTNLELQILHSCYKVVFTIYIS